VITRSRSVRTDFIKDGSYSQTTVAADVYGPITVTGDYGCKTVDAMATAAVSTATGLGVDFSKYNHIVFVFPVLSCSFGGLGTGFNDPTDAITHQFGYIWMPISADYNSPGTDEYFENATAHEFGHNLTLGHNNTLDFGALTLGPIDYVAVNPGTVDTGGTLPNSSGAAKSATISANAAAATPNAVPTGSTKITAVNTEYGDQFATIGGGRGPFNGQHEVQKLGWIPGSNALDITASTAVSIFPTENSTGLRALHVLRDPATSSWIWVEFHQPIGTYTPYSESIDPLASNPNTLLTGAQLHYEDGFIGGNHTYLMNMTPASVPNNFYNSNLPPGSSWSDPFSLLTITAGAQGTTLPVTVSYDAACAIVSLNANSIPAAGGTGSVTITAPDTCNWSVSSNASWISFPNGATTGTGSATINFTAGANTATTQRNTYITAQRQSLPLVQLSTAVTIVGLDHASNTAAPDVTIPIVLHLSDAQGVSDLSQINLTIAGGNSADCAAVGISGGNNSDISIFLNGASNSPITTGTPGTLTNGSCTIDTGNSSYSASGNNATLTLAVSFPSTFQGVHNITAEAGTSGTIPVGFVNVTTKTTSTSSVAISPAFGNQGTTVPVTLTGTNSTFTAGSTVTVSGSGVTVSGVTFGSATSLTTNLVIAPSATTGQYIVTVTSGSEVDTATFTVNTKPIPSVTIAPFSGDQGTTVPFSIAGTNTHFTAGTTVSVSGTGVGVSGLSAGSATSLSGSFVINSAATMGPLTVTITSGTEVVSTTFTVNAVAAPVISFSPASGAAATTVPVTVSGTNTAFVAGSTIAFSGSGIKATKITRISATSLTADFVIDASAVAGQQTVTIVSGTQVATAPFTIVPSVVATATATPSSGNQGDMVTVRFTGTNTAFSPSSVITISGAGVTINEVNALNSSTISATFVIASGANAKQRTVTITTGTQVVTVPFTITAFTQTLTSIQALPTHIQIGQPATLTIIVAASTGSGIPTGQVSFVDNSAPSFPATLATVPLSNGMATFTPSNLTIGSHLYSAQYLGDNTLYAPSVSTTSATVVVTAAGTYTTTQSLTSNGSSPYTFTDVATFYGQVAPGGMINFRDTTTGTLLGSFAPTPLTQTLAAPTLFAASTNAKGIPSSVVGDFNNDGIPDIATTNVFDTTVSVMLGKPNGTYRAAQTFGTGSAPYGIAVGDFDGDGNLDLVTSNLADNTVSVLLGKGNGNFAVEKLFVVGHDPYSVNVADLDGDGILDLVVTDLDDKTISVLIGRGNGTFKAQKTYATGTQPIAAAVADFNGDGKMDVAVANVSDNTVGLLLGNGDGTFQAMTTFTTGQSPYSIRTADFNQDGKPDLVVSNAFSNSVSILLNGGTNTFLPQVSYATGTTPTAVVTLNYDGTNHQSLAVANFSDNTLGILVGKGDGTFLPQVTFPTIASPYQLAVGDLNVDGKQDLVVGNFGTSQFATQLGTQTVVVTLSGATPGAGDTITAAYAPSAGDAYSRSTSPITLTSAAPTVVRKTAK
jgi:hypothetical protein